jgi:hypothetical protein
MAEFTVRLSRPSPEELAGYNRAEKYKLLKANSVKHRDEIQTWIKDRGLSDEVFKIDEPTAFDMLFITCTPRVARYLKDADGVIDVSVSPEFSVALLNS